MKPGGERRRRRRVGEEREPTGDAAPRQITDADRQSWFEDPTGFVRDELGGTLWEMQARVLEAVRDHTRVVVRSCNGSGKTYAAAYTVLWWLMCFGDALVITTAPTDH